MGSLERFESDPSPKEATNDNRTDFKTDPELAAALARLGEKIEANQKNIRDFETPGGFIGTAQYDESGSLVQFSLTKKEGAGNGNYSIFTVDNGTLYLQEIRDVDGKHVDEENLIAQHKVEAASNFGSSIPKQIDAQYELDL